MIRLNSYSRILYGASLAAVVALSAGADAGYGQTVQPNYGAQIAQIAQSPMPMAGQHNLPITPVAIAPEPCGGDFGMLEQLEAERHDVRQVNPSGGPYCN
jgi:hypothetical protein